MAVQEDAAEDAPAQDTQTEAEDSTTKGGHQGQAAKTTESVREAEQPEEASPVSCSVHSYRSPISPSVFKSYMGSPLGSFSHFC